MVIADLKKTTDQKMDKSVQAFKADLAKVRTGRAHTGILDHVMVDYYGNPTPINQVAKVTLLDSRTIGVTPFEKKMVQAVDKAIRESDLGLNPSSQGGLIRVPLPALNEERRREDLLLKIGIHEGPCIAVMLNERQDYFGQTVNIASRVQHLATSREIFATGTVVENESASGLLKAQGLAPISHSAALRGITAEVPIYAIP